MISRLQYESLIQDLNGPKALILLGARQTGKTTLARMLTDTLQNQVLWLYGDDTDTAAMFKSPNSDKLKHIIGQYRYVVIDEAQRIENIGLCLKIIIDQIPNVKVIATGSSSFELSNQINEPLTGRKWEYKIFPIATAELIKSNGLISEQRMLHQRLVYGFYPEVINNPGREQEVLKLLSNDYLYKDILSMQVIRKPHALEKLLQALSFQVGNLVSNHELGQMAGLDNQTVEHYLDLLEKSFIIFRLSSLSRNLRNELKKSKKIYFYDNGIRNAIINQFNPIELRNDVGALWENYLVSERQKNLNIHKNFANVFFWRSKQQKEIDYVEEFNGQTLAYEFKWNGTTKVNLHQDFASAYNVSTLKVISPENYLDFVTKAL